MKISEVHNLHQLKAYLKTQGPIPPFGTLKRAIDAVRDPQYKREKKRTGARPGFYLLPGAVGIAAMLEGALEAGDIFLALEYAFLLGSFAPIGNHGSAAGHKGAGQNVNRRLSDTEIKIAVNQNIEKGMSRAAAQLRISSEHDLKLRTVKNASRGPRGRPKSV